jgi:hypothetical protein
MKVFIVSVPVVDERDSADETTQESELFRVDS